MVKSKTCNEYIRAGYVSGAFLSDPVVAQYKYAQQLTKAFLNGIIRYIRLQLLTSRFIQRWKQEARGLVWIVPHLSSYVLHFLLPGPLYKYTYLIFICIQWDTFDANLLYSVLLSILEEWL